MSNSEVDRLSEKPFRVRADKPMRVNSSSTCAWNPASDFEQASNPGTVWSYGWADAFGSTPHPYTLHRFEGGVDLWSDPLNYRIGTPEVSHNATQAVITHLISVSDGTETKTVTWLPGEVIIHPSRMQFSVVRFTAPGAGTYAVTATYTSRDTAGATTDVHVYCTACDNYGALLLHSNITHAVPQVSLPRTLVTMRAGETLDFIVGPGVDSSGLVRGVDFLSDSTGLHATIALASPPDPKGASSSAAWNIR